MNARERCGRVRSRVGRGDVVAMEDKARTQKGEELQNKVVTKGCMAYLWTKK